MIDFAILKELSEQLNHHNITWGIGGSCLLMLYNLYSEPNDLDLWVQPDDMLKVRELFAAYEEIQTDIPLPEELHYKMIYRNVEVDFVACFIIKPNQHQYRFDICPENIRMISVGDMQIPCTCLEDWFIIYNLLNKSDKAKIIRDYFSEHQIEFDKSAIERAVQYKNVSLPSRLENDIHLLFINATQLSFPLPSGTAEVEVEQNYPNKKEIFRKKPPNDIPVLFIETIQMSFSLSEEEENFTCVSE